MSETKVNSQEPQVQENKMGVMPVKKLIVTMSLPMMLSMLVQALYNIVDSIFVSRINESALAATSLAFPAQMLMIAIGAGTGVGINAILSKSLGAKKFSDADKAANTGLFLIFVSYIVLMVLSLFAVKPFVASQIKEGTENAAQIMQYSTDYLSICYILSFGILFEMTFERLLQSTGKTFYTMITQSVGAVINMILDPILIFGLLGAPKLGIKGAAIATVVGQTVAMAMAIYFNIKKNHEITLSLGKIFRPDIKTIKNIYIIAVPTIIMQAIGSVMTFAMNKIIAPFSMTAVAVFGVYFKLNSFIFMPIFGLNNGLIPIIAYNYGARNKKRITEGMKFSLVISVSLMVIGMLIFFAVPDKLLMLFKASPQMIDIGSKALRTIAIHFPIAGCCIIFMATFQAFGEGFVSLIVSLVRQLCVLVPAAYILSRIAGLDAIWFAFPIAELSSVIISGLFFRNLYIKKIKNL